MSDTTRPQTSVSSFNDWIADVICKERRPAAEDVKVTREQCPVCNGYECGVGPCRHEWVSL